MKLKILILLSILLVSCGGTPVKPDATLKIALVKLNDNGASGELIGCGDSIVYIDKTAEEGNKVQVALEELFVYGTTATTDEYYNGLQYAKNLKVDSVNVSENPGKTTIEIRISGEMASGGTCDDPRITEQIMSTIKANTTADEIKVYINDKDLDGYFNMK